MRVALCLSGLMRGFQHTIYSFRKHLLDHLPCDIYVSTWDIVGHSQYKLCSPHHGRRPEEPLTANMLKQIYGKWLKAYNIKPFDTESILPEWIKPIDSPLQRRTASMYYHIYEANRLKKESGINYGLTIRCRPDLIFESRIAVPVAEEVLALTVNRPYRNRHVFIPALESFHHHTNDQFMYGATGTMDLVADIYRAILTPQKFWCVDPAEKTLEHYMAQHDIRYTAINMKYIRDS